MKRKTNQLVFFELHVDDRTFYLHGIVKARDKAEADMMLQSVSGKNYHLQVKGFLGKATLKNMTWALKDSVPRDAFIDLKNENICLCQNSSPCGVKTVDGKCKLQKPNCTFFKEKI